MDDHSIQHFARDSNARALVLSLKSSNFDVSHKLFANMYTRMSESIRVAHEITHYYGEGTKRSILVVATSGRSHCACSSLA